VIKSIAEVNMSIPYAEIDENIALVSFEGPLSEGVRKDYVEEVYFT